MEIQVFAVLDKKEDEWCMVNNKPVDTIECDLSEINHLSLSKRTRTIGIGKNLFKPTLQSWKMVKKEFEKRNQLSKFI